jgi:hypothetical protein
VMRLAEGLITLNKSFLGSEIFSLQRYE